jgi:ABC-type glycerol-3-phosphate transport system substrate-binding protein
MLTFAVTLAACGGNGESSGKTVITYANWNLGSPDDETPNMERLMIEAFEAANPDIDVQIIERPKIPGTTNDVSWSEFLAARASTESLPDVFMADDIPYYVVNDWAYDISDIANADAEYLNVSEDIRGVSTYDGHVMALPNAVFYAGYVVNKTLYDQRGQDWPTTTTTFDEFITLTKAAANHSSTNNTGIVGLEGIEHIIHWYPAQLNEDFGWFTLTDEGFNLDSTAFSQTIDFYRSLQTDTSFVLDALYYEAAQEDSNIDLDTIFQGGSAGAAFNNGVVLAKWFYSWDFGWMQANINSGEYTWNLDFIGTPVVNGNKRVPIVADFFTIASNTEHPEEAYKLAKWMGFGKDGYLKRIELSTTVEGISQVNFAPLQNDATLLDAYFNLYPAFTGLRSIVESGTVVVEPPKYLPGYINARYQGTYDAENKMGDIIDKLRFGEVLFADVRTNLNNRANAIYDESSTAFNQKISSK